MKLTPMKPLVHVIQLELTDEELGRLYSVCETVSRPAWEQHMTKQESATVREFAQKLLAASHGEDS